MTLALPRTLDKARAKERQQLAERHGCIYHCDVRKARYLDSSFNAGTGFKPVVFHDGEGDGDFRLAWEGPIYTKEKDRKLAMYHAEIAADQLRRHFLMHGKRYEVERREEAERRQQERKARIEARKALTEDRVALYEAVDGIVRHVPAAAIDASEDLRKAIYAGLDLLSKHRTAVEDIKSGREL